MNFADRLNVADCLYFADHIRPTQFLACFVHKFADHINAADRINFADHINFSKN